MFPSVATSPNFLGYLTVPKGCGGVRNYNGSTCRWRDKLLHCWRAEDGKGKSTLWMGKISAGRRITRARVIVTAPEYDAEDPRMWVEDDNLKLMWSRVRDTRHDSGSWTVVQMISIINPVTFEVLHTAEWKLPPVKLRQVEKNWTPCPDGSVLYHMEAGLSMRPDGTAVRNAAFDYPWGSFSGSTPAVVWPERGTWLLFFHGFMHHAARDKRYYFGAAEISPRTHEVLRISRVPLVFASDDDDTIVCPRAAAYNPCVVFPAGLARCAELDGYNWLVSGGVHDSRDAWWMFGDTDLQLVPRAEALAVTKLLADPSCEPLAGHVIVTVKKIPIYEGGYGYVAGESFQTSAARAHALREYVTIVR